MPTRVIFGEGVLAHLPLLHCVQSAKAIALFVGGKSLRASGHFAEIQQMLAGKNLHIIDGVPPEPSPTDVESATEQLRTHGIDCVVAVGGGSVMDLAKAAALCAVQSLTVREVLGGLATDFRRPVPIVAIPTTAGTGSEVTPFSVFWDKVEKKKYSVHHDYQYPTDALVDPLLTYSAPPAVTANTGMDAFTQACEAYWNKNHSPLSDDYALMAVRHIFTALPKAVQNGHDAAARSALSLGSLQAGLGFSNTRTTACHSISYPMTLHWNVAHGQAVGITLPDVLRLNATVMPDRSARFCAALAVTSIDEAAENIRQMMEKSGLKTRLSVLGIATDADLDLIVAEGFTPERMGNNPFTFTSESLKDMLQRIL